MKKNFSVKVRKLTDEELMRETCEMTFLGKSKQSLLSMYKSEHSPARSQMFWVVCENIPLFISTHLLRHHVGSQPYQLTCRDDRHGGNCGLVDKIDSINSRLRLLYDGMQNGDYDGAEDTVEDIIEELRYLQENSDRYTPVNLGILVNAQSLIDMGKLRECMQAHKETREVFAEIKAKITEVDPDLAKMMVKKCVYRGGICGEPKCCGYNTTMQFDIEMTEYIENFSNKQKGFYLNAFSYKKHTSAL